MRMLGAEVSSDDLGHSTVDWLTALNLSLSLSLSDH